MRRLLMGAWKASGWGMLTRGIKIMCDWRVGIFTYILPPTLDLLGRERDWELSGSPMAIDFINCAYVMETP